MDPKLIEVPGIPGKLQEMSLEQYMAALSPDHYARKQLEEIRAQALKAVELSTQLMAANEKIAQLQAKLFAYDLKITLDTPAATAAAKPDARTGPWAKVPCPTCGKLVTSSPGGWASHQRNAHPDNMAPKPVV
jgi:hypothetical protein